ncbi:MAG: SPASM domain-containing protein, partial [Anaerolineae bacterium]
GLDFIQQVVALQQRYGQSGQVVSNGLQTNGLLLDAEWARFLREYRFLVGISLDGPALWHDKYRHTRQEKPTQEHVLASLRLLRRYDVETNILAVVNRDTVQHPVEIFEYFLNLGFRYLQFIPCVEFDPVTGQPTEFSVSPEQFGDFLCTLFDRWYNHGNPEASIRDFDAILAGHLGQLSPMCCYQPRCGSYLVVEYNGDLYPCDFYVQEERRIGNLTDTSLQTAFASSLLEQFADHKAEPRPECTACPWYSLCQQGCPRFLYHGRHYLCQSYQRFLAYSKPAYLSLVAQIENQQPIQRAVGVGRNDPCPCGSGRKFKQCCGKRTA